MAVNVDTVYKTVLFILNKEQRGYMTPDEFNKVGQQVQLEIFENYFEELSKGQSPSILYIGCSDSRVTAEDLMGVQPGEVFITRNIANMVINQTLDINQEQDQQQQQKQQEKPILHHDL